MSKDFHNKTPKVTINLRKLFKWIHKKYLMLAVTFLSSLASCSVLQVHHELGLYIWCSTCIECLSRNIQVMSLPRNPYFIFMLLLMIAVLTSAVCISSLLFFCKLLVKVQWQEIHQHILKLFSILGREVGPYLHDKYLHDKLMNENTDTAW